MARKPITPFIVKAPEAPKRGGQPTHGQGSRENSTPTYKVWKGMRGRCMTPTDSAYYKYGGRGITVCTRWNDYANFFADMGERPEGMTLERKDNDGNYEPGNCVWATPTEQANNTRATRRITAFGETKSMQNWVRDPRCAVSQASLHERLAAGWSSEAAISTPPTKLIRSN